MSNTTTPTTATADAPTATNRFRHLFPVDTSRTIFRAGHSEQPIHIHCIASKAALIHFLTPPLYYLLPIGIEAALTDSNYDENTSTSSSTDNKQSTMYTTETSNVSSSFNQWLDKLDSTTHTPTHVQSTTATYIGDSELIVSKKSYTTPISFITTTTNRRSNNTQFSLADQVYINTSLTLPIEASVEAQQLWLSMETTINTIMNNLDCSIFLCTQGGTGGGSATTTTGGAGNGGSTTTSSGGGGCELVLIAKEVRKYTETDPYDSDTCTDAGIVKDDTYHVIAVDFAKDQSRTTDPEEWEKKLDLLTSYRYIVPRLRAALKARDPSNELVYHIVLAGRPEHSW